jgi:uncharacterized protein (TIGR03435 family)
MRKPAAAALLAIASLLAPWALQAQAPAAGDPKLSFEVASIKPNNSGRLITGSFFRAGRYNATNTTLQTQILLAYDLQQFRLVGGPAWMDTDRFDITATAQGTPSPETLRPLLRSLLQERFALVTHRETRELPVYRLVLARNDRALGKRLVKSDVDCALSRGKVPDPCTSRSSSGRFLATAVLFNSFLRTLQSAVDRAIVDDTGLSGSYDVDLEWAAQQDDASKPSIFTALQEQLGLKLESARGPVDVLVIDHAEPPTPNAEGAQCQRRRPSCSSAIIVRSTAIC